MPRSAADAHKPESLSSEKWPLWERKRCYSHLQPYMFAHTSAALTHCRLREGSINRCAREPEAGVALNKGLQRIPLLHCSEGGEAKVGLRTTLQHLALAHTQLSCPCDSHYVENCQLGASSGEGGFKWRTFDGTWSMGGLVTSANLLKSIRHNKTV